MGLFGDVRKPVTCPSQLVSDAREQDPRGDRLHVGFAALFMFCLPIDTAPASISWGMLAGLLALRLLLHGAVRRSLSPLLRSWTCWAIALWAAWTILTIAWSTDPVTGWDHAGALRMILLPALLFPVLTRWRILLGALLAGVALQGLMQVGELVLAFSSGASLTRPSGLMDHPGLSAMFMGTAAVIWLSILVTSQRIRWYLLVGLVLAVFGVVVAQGRGIWIGCLLAVLVVIWQSIASKRVPARRLIAILICAAVFAGGAGLLVGKSARMRLSDIPASITGFFNGNANTGGEYRLTWWRGALDASVEGPAVFVFGRGLGSTTTVDFAVKGSRIPSRTSHPHNVLVQSLYEGGLIGLVLFLFLLWRIAWGDGGRREVVSSIAIPALVVLWVGAGMFEGLQNSGGQLAVLMLAASFSVALGLVNPRLQTVGSSRPRSRKGVAVGVVEPVAE
ncbi:MAG: O-antigen ligase family protein [Phycisphaerales bacterium]|nr:O-antigen ligase family protein [Phycisphaerales bacterium]